MSCPVVLLCHSRSLFRWFRFRAAARSAGAMAWSCSHRSGAAPCCGLGFGMLDSDGRLTGPFMTARARLGTAGESRLVWQSADGQGIVDGTQLHLARRTSDRGHDHATPAFDVPPGHPGGRGGRVATARARRNDATCSRNLLRGRAASRRVRDSSATHLPGRPQQPRAGPAPRVLASLWVKILTPAERWRPSCWLWCGGCC
jgi:hypothetical protein